MNFSTPLQTKACSNCGASFGCGANSPGGDCWCAELAPVGVVASPEDDCLCPKCLGEAIAKVNSSSDDAGAVLPANEPPPALIEGEDYYWEGPAMVFTARFLLRRGYCCESGCRHCPYPKEGTPD